MKCDSAENDEIEIGNGRLIRCRKQSTAFQVLPQEGLKNENIEFIIGMPLNQVSLHSLYYFPFCKCAELYVSL